MITLEYRNSADNWEEFKTFENQEDLRQEINSFLYNFTEFEEIYNQEKYRDYLKGIVEDENFCVEETEDFYT